MSDKLLSTLNLFSEDSSNQSKNSLTSSSHQQFILDVDDLHKVESNPEGNVISREDLQNFVDKELGVYMNSPVRYAYGDKLYYCPTVEEITQVITSTARVRGDWVENRYDCDDMAYVLKAFASSTSLKNPDMRAGLCVGIVWGKFKWTHDGYHACNWVVTYDRQEEIYEIHLIEPNSSPGFLRSKTEAIENSIDFLAV